LAPLSAFRFDDHLIWGVIGAMVVVLVPSLAAGRVVALNALLVFGALYALRGFGIMMWFLVVPGRRFGATTVWLVALACALVWPLWTLPLSIGLSDTYFDWRRRRRPSNLGSGL
jgi:hypothetical protein